MGSAGAGSFIGFKEHVIDRSKARIYALLHISYLGLHGAVYDPINFVIVGENVKPLILKLHTGEALQKPVMAHINVEPPTHREVFMVLRKGYIL